MISAQGDKVATSTDAPALRERISAIALGLIERGSLPEFAVRFLIKEVCRGRLRSLNRASIDEESTELASFIEELKRSPIAIETAAANEQHYEVPTRFYQLVLGENLKYSSCYFDSKQDSLTKAEVQMLELTKERAELKDGMRILELGCGWGSLTLWMAKAFPNSQIVAVSNSATQREHIESQCKLRKLSNVSVITADMNRFEPPGEFDRVVSVEMFEHMRNYRELLGRIYTWLKPEGKLFVHIFCNERYAYPYTTTGNMNWLGRYFFSGGIMPNFGIFSSFQEQLLLEREWKVSGDHYQLTADRWAENLRRNQAEITKLFEQTYGPTTAKLWVERWWVFFLACSELFGFRNGREWFVGHYLLRKR